MKQSQVDKLYAGLKDLAGERRAKLDEALRLFQLSREVDDLEQWITERELVASSQELGQDYDHVTVSDNYDLSALSCKNKMVYYIIILYNLYSTEKIGVMLHDFMMIHNV